MAIFCKKRHRKTEVSVEKSTLPGSRGGARRRLCQSLVRMALLSSLMALVHGGCRREANSPRIGNEGKGNSQVKGQVIGRVITLTPSLTEIVFALGAGERIVGVSDYCDYPPEATQRPRVGTFLQPSLEKILSLRPDLVLVDGVQQDVASALRHAGARVLPVPMNDLAQVRAAIEQVGAALGDRQAAAATLRAQLDGELAEVGRLIRGRARPKVMFVVDRQVGGLRGLIVAGPGSYLDELMQLAGGVNVFSDLPTRYAKVAVETVEERQPEVIFDAVHTGPDRQAQVLADWQGLRRVPAVARGQVYILDTAGTQGGREFVTPGPRLGQALRRLAALLHPEVAAPAGAPAKDLAPALAAPAAVVTPPLSIKR